MPGSHAKPAETSASRDALGSHPGAGAGPLWHSCATFQPAPFSNVSLLALGNLLLFSILMTVVKIP